MSAKNDRKRLQEENVRMKAEIKRIKGEIKMNQAKIVELALKVKCMTIYNHSQLQRFLSLLPLGANRPVHDEQATLNEFFYTLSHTKMVGYIHLVENMKIHRNKTIWSFEIRKLFGSDHCFLLMLSEVLKILDHNDSIFINLPHKIICDTLFKRLQDDLGFQYSSTNDRLEFIKIN